MNKTYKIKKSYCFLIMPIFILLLWVSSVQALSPQSKPAARMTDLTAHGGTITIGCPTVLIEGKPAARIGDMHTCPMVIHAGPQAIPHVGGPISTGSGTVIICGKPAARVGDMAICQGPPDSIIKGSHTVFIGD